MPLTPEEVVETEEAEVVVARLDQDVANAIDRQATRVTPVMSHVATCAAAAGARGGAVVTPDLAPALAPLLIPHHDHHVLARPAQPEPLRRAVALLAPLSPITG